MVVNRRLKKLSRKKKRKKEKEKESKFCNGFVYKPLKPISYEKKRERRGLYFLNPDTLTTHTHAHEKKKREKQERERELVGGAFFL